MQTSCCHSPSAAQSLPCLYKKQQPATPTISAHSTPLMPVAPEMKKVTRGWPLAGPAANHRARDVGPARTFLFHETSCGDWRLQEPCATPWIARGLHSVPNHRLLGPGWRRDLAASPLSVQANRRPLSTRLRPRRLLEG